VHWVGYSGRHSLICFFLQLLQKSKCTNADYALRSIMATWTAVVSIIDWRYFKATGMHRGSEVTEKNDFV
jgi:hypothetical protein